MEKAGLSSKEKVKGRNFSSKVEILVRLQLNFINKLYRTNIGNTGLSLRKTLIPFKGRNFDDQIVTKIGSKVGLV